ncbi:conserved hypothetical protein [Histoplasma capsulatum G186AR]|uniref:Uncharacterized protein n=2 Tax=Ajellomyces capsulatus TaxID=5037 RepID=C0NQF9_AJECG|nr:uncharacterized protein HCBG_05747 [Histoplasma capsulatum G186AR]EEH06431.1 conserved hypothetical protein [Histoplasma capsulatum G186AR]KAG5293106.1 hypothetical protein I7I52_04312 [Histoplasma capsulatum]QSS74557.1 hypothetical protein I7I50_03405 [Histoplasma capsulatum G186AR]
MDPDSPHPVHELPNPPLSPRKRRQLLRESEDTDGLMTVETYIVRSDPYRSSTLPNPPPWPLAFDDPPSDALKLVQDSHSTIVGILTRHGFTETDAAIRLSAIHKPGYPGNQDATLLLQILFHSEVPRRLGPATDEIRAFFQHHRFNSQEIHVEIARSDLVFQPSLFAIDAENEIIPHFEHIRADLVTFLQTRLGDSWRMLCLCLAGRTEEKAKPTIVVMVDPYTSGDWSNILSEMNLIIRSQERATFAVEFLPGSLPQINSTEDSEKGELGVSYLNRLDTESPLEMGCSIGVCGKEGGGTMGGFLTLTSGRSVYKGFLTNYHVVRNLSESPEALAEADRFGVSPNRGTTGGDVFYLAKQDISATQQDADDSIKGLQQQLQEFKSEQHDREVAGAHHSIRIQKGIENSEKKIEVFEATRKIVDSMPINIGQVRFASGKALVQDKKRIMDWAFVGLAKSSLKLFKPNRMPTVPLSQEPRQYGIDRSVSVLASQPLDSFGKITRGSYFLKSGRTTGVTAGICNGVLATCNWCEEDRMRFDSQGNQVEIRSGQTEEFIIFSKRAHIARHEQTEFCAPGDSGSLIINEMGEVCGLLYGSVSLFCSPVGEQSFYASAGLVMTMDEVTESIKMKMSSQGLGDVPAIGLGL